jgi:hypothetical protein
MSYISLGCCLLTVLSPSTRHVAPPQKHVRPTQLVQLRDELKKGQINGVKRRLASSILVEEYSRLQSDLVVGPVKDLAEQPWPLLPEDDSVNPYFCLMERVSRRDTKTVDWLLKALKKLVIRSEFIDSGHRLELSNNSDLSPREGVYGKLASNVDWIVQTRTVRGKMEIVGVILAYH